jgi:hypothetical protein
MDLSFLYGLLDISDERVQCHFKEKNSFMNSLIRRGTDIESYIVSAKPVCTVKVDFLRLHTGINKQ